jgi:hypothetical protein
MDKCSICEAAFSLDQEGGIKGDFGIMPVQFCPSCLCCILEMAEQLNQGEL